MPCCGGKDPADLNSFGLNKHRVMKLIILGEAGVGKTSLLFRFVGHEFPERVESTIAIDFKILEIGIDDEDFKVQMWDTSGQERFHSLTRQFYNAADAVVLVYSERKRSTLAQLEHFWVKEIKKYSIPAKHVLIIGNQNDRLRKDKPMIEDDELRRICSGFRTTIAHMSAKKDSAQHCQDVIDNFCQDVLMYKYQLAGPIESTSGSSEAPVAPDLEGFHHVRLEDDD